MQDENYFGDSDDDNNNLKQELKNNLDLEEDNFDDDLMGGEEDRKMLAQLTELEREQILMARHKKREDMLRKKELLDKLNKQKAQERSGLRGDFDRLKVSVFWQRNSLLTFDLEGQKSQKN